MDDRKLEAMRVAFRHLDMVVKYGGIDKVADTIDRDHLVVAHATLEEAIVKADSDQTWGRTA